MEPFFLRCRRLLSLLLMWTRWHRSVTRLFYIDLAGTKKLLEDREKTKKSSTSAHALEGLAQAHIQALYLTEGMSAPALAWLACAKFL
jgi:hypothetical protein